MKKKILAFCMLAATGAFWGTSAHAGTISESKVIEIPGLSQQQLMQKVATWSKRYGQSYNTNNEAGVVVMNDAIAYPSAPIDRIQYRILFKVKNSIQNGKDTVTFEDVRLKSPVTYLQDDTHAGGYAEIAGKAEPVKSAKDITTVNRELKNVANNLENFLRNAELTRCVAEK